MEINFTIPDEKVDELKQAFLKAYPIPLDEDEQTPLYGDLVWFKLWIRKGVIRALKRGKELTLREQLNETVDENIFIGGN